MKKILSLVLAVALLAALAATPTLAEEINGNGQMPQAVEKLAGELAEETAPENTQNADTGSGAVSEQIAVVTVSEKEDGNVPTLRFDELEDTMEKNNYTVRSLKAQLDDMEDMDLSTLEGAVGMLKQLAAGINTTKRSVDAALGQLEQTGHADQNLLLTYGALSATLQADSAMLDSQITSLESQVASAESSMEQGEDTIHNAIDQMVKGAEALYVGIVTMENAAKDVRRGMDTLDRTVAIFEKQLELGMASAYDVESMKYQRSSVASQMEALNFQIATSKITLEGLCGLEITGKIRLEPLALPTASELSGVDYEKTLNVATNRNLDVMNARRENDADDADDTATRYGVHAAEDTFAYNYKIICLTVGEKERLLKAAKETVTFQERTFAIEAKEYELGMISYEEYMVAKNNLEQAKSDYAGAQLELFTAYRNYIWARDKGIV